MGESAQNYIFEVEALLKSYGEEIAVRRLQNDVAPPAPGGFDSRPIIAAFLAFLICAPGCAAAAVFLLKADANVPPLVTPDSNSPLVMKSDRLPLSQWSAKAAVGAEAKSVARSALADPAFLFPIAIRGSLDDAFNAPANATPAVAEIPPEPAVRTPQPRLKRAARRIAPPKIFAEAVQPDAPPPPSLFEKMFGARSL
ncbi:MAG: hypothetical protein JWR80_5408 [Bradyrhizobium sp.]|nr:hypothetical protein [Bradyrhizobium sp.]